MAMFCYGAAIGLSALGTAWVVGVHWPLWRDGKVIFGPFVALVVIEYVAVSLVLWGLGYLFNKKKVLDLGFAFVTALPFVLLAVVPSRDWVG